jgi:hypothetical protein
MVTKGKEEKAFPLTPKQHRLWQKILDFCKGHDTIFHQEIESLGSDTFQDEKPNIKRAIVVFLKNGFLVCLREKFYQVNRDRLCSVSANVAVDRGLAPWKRPFGKTTVKGERNG